MTKPQISTRVIAKRIAAQRGISLDAAQRVTESTVKRMTEKQREQFAQGLARASWIPIDQAREVVARAFADTVPSGTPLAQRLATAANMPLQSAETLLRDVERVLARATR